MLQIPSHSIPRSRLDPRDENLLSRIILPEECTLTVAKYLASLSASSPVTVTRNRLQGTALLARKIVVRRGIEDKRLAVADDCVDAMSRVPYFVSHPKAIVSPRTIERWMKELYGKRTVVDGRLVFNDKYTSLYPHKFDACGDCERLKDDKQTIEQSFKRHRQQNDQGTLSRQAAIVALQKQMVDLETEHDAHLKKAAVAVQHHKDLISPARKLYDEICAAWSELTRPGHVATEAKIDTFCELASAYVIEVSSDFQQDKLIPAWNDSPQPGTTYCMSGITFYIHILCFESCGYAAGPSRLSRNLVFVRDERVAGPKTCDDTLSTAVEALFGRKSPAFSQPPRFRTGYNGDGKLI
eukprot:IDg3814t1